MCMSNLRVSKTVEEYKTNLRDFGNRLDEFASVDVRVSEHEYASFIYAKNENRGVEVMEDDSGVWIEFYEINREKPEKEFSYLSYEQAYGPIKSWLK